MTENHPHKNEVIDMVLYAWRAIAHGFWFLLSTILYGKETDVLLQAKIKMTAARMRVLKHQAARREAEQKDDDPPEELEKTNTLKMEAIKIEDHLKSVSSAGIPKPIEQRRASGA